MKIFYIFVLSSAFAVVSYAADPAVVNGSDGIPDDRRVFELRGSGESLKEIVAPVPESLAKDESLLKVDEKFNASDSTTAFLKPDLDPQDEMVDDSDDDDDEGDDDDEADGAKNYRKAVILYDILLNATNQINNIVTPEDVEGLRYVMEDLNEQLATLNSDDAGAETLADAKKYVLKMTEQLRSGRVEDLSELQLVWKDTKEVLEKAIELQGLMVTQIPSHMKEEEVAALHENERESADGLVGTDSINVTEAPASRRLLQFLE